MLPPRTIEEMLPQQPLELAIRGAAAGTPGAGAMATKQALIGTLPTPSFLADVK
jgi:hypothetical protein